MKLAPAFLPPGLDPLGCDVREDCSQPRFAGRVRVDDELAVCLLEPLRVELEQARACLLDRFAGGRDRDPAKLALAQRKALFSLSKNPSPGR